MIQLYEYLLNKKKQKTLDMSSIDILSEKPNGDILNDMKNKKYNGYTYVICDFLLDLYNEGYECIIGDEEFENIYNNFKGFRIKHKDLNYAIEIYNVEKLIEVYITLDSLPFLRVYTIPENRKTTKKDIIDSKIALREILLIKNCDPNRMEEFKEKLNKLIYK